MKNNWPEGTIKCIKVFNETKNIGEIHFFNKEDKEIEYRYFKREKGKETFIDPPKGDNRKCFSVSLQADWQNSNDDLIIVDSQEKKEVKKIPRRQVVQTAKEEALTFLAKDLKDKNLEKIEDTNSFFNHLKNEGESVVQNLDGLKTIQVKPEQAIAFLQSQQMPTALYKSVNPATEFGIARFIADQVNHLPRLLEKAEVRKPKGSANYIIYAEKTLNKEQKLSFNYVLVATSAEEALKIAEKVKKKLTGLGLKIWLVCWEIGNEKKKLSFPVELTEIMRRCHPERKSYFSEKEKEEFYEELKRLKTPEFVLEQNIKKPQDKKDKILKYNIPMLFISAETGREGKPPQIVQINLFNIQTIAPERKTSYIGAPIKRTTLSLEARDTSLSAWLQIRISQLKGGDKKNKTNTSSHDFHREDLIRAAGLTQTNKSNPWKANTLLLQKLSRYKKSKIIKKYPEKITEIVTLHF